MAEQEFKRALGYAMSAIELLTRSQIPPYPQFYELLYTYATGVNPSLNARINALFRDGDPTIELAEALYEEFLRAQDVSERISNVSERMGARISEAYSAIDSAMSNAKTYSTSLEAAQNELQGEITADNVKAMATRLLVETERMQSINRQLEGRLQASRDDIANLRHDLNEVRRESMLDPLTKIYNRKYFDEGLSRAMISADNTGRPMTLVLVDIDNFKRFNDTWGHQTGDQVLRLVAMTLRSNRKGKDVVARYGGEEFAAVLPETDLNGAVIVADHMRKAIQAKELLKRSTNEKLGRITASFGVALYRPGEGASALIERADRCLYAAKHAGRNRVCDETELTTGDGDTVAA